jgi:drug/metabolite transporter (DMT)-like permease
MFLLFVLYAFFASTFIIGREAVLAVPPMFFIGIRMVLAGILLVGFVRIFNKESFKIKKEDLFWFAGIVLFHIYGSYVLEFISLQYLTGAKASLLFNLSPFITALFSYFFFGELLSPKKWLGLLIGFLAFIPLLITQPVSTESTTHTTYAEILLIISVTASCIGWIFMKRLISQHNHSYVFVNGVGMFLGGILSLGTSYFFEVWPSITSLSCNIPFVRSLLLLILVGNIICYNLYGKLLHRYSATILSFFGCTTPIFGVLFGWLWLGETVSPWFYVTATLAAIGLYIFYQEDLKEGIINKGK